MASEKTGSIRTLAEAFSRLHGQKLTAVQFIHDYVQLGFESAGLTAHSHPVVRIAGHAFDRSVAVYEHELCKRIGKEVVQSRLTETEAVFIFEDEAQVIIPIDDAHSSTSESLEFSLEGIDMIWVA